MFSQEMSNFLSCGIQTVSQDTRNVHWVRLYSGGWEITPERGINTPDEIYVLVDKDQELEISAHYTWSGYQQLIDRSMRYCTYTDLVGVCDFNYGTWALEADRLASKIGWPGGEDAIIWLGNHLDDLEQGWRSGLIVKPGVWDLDLVNPLRITGYDPCAFGLYFCPRRDWRVGEELPVKLRTDCWYDIGVLRGVDGVFDPEPRP